MARCVLTASAFLVLAISSQASSTSHRRLASDVLELVNTAAALKAGIKTAVSPALETLREAGAPENALTEMKTAMDDWAANDLVWEEVKPRLVDLYVREFSEVELAQLLAFYRTPVGAKVLNRYPTIIEEGGRIGQEYAESKQGLLNDRLEKIADKYKAGRKQPAAATAHTHAHH